MQELPWFSTNIIEEYENDNFFYIEKIVEDYKKQYPMANVYFDSTNHRTNIYIWFSNDADEAFFIMKES